jgi:uncharacterized membrane protein
MIVELIRIVLGILIVLFMPGYLLSVVLFRKLRAIERIGLALGLSVFIVVFMGFFLTVLVHLTSLEGITTQSVWISLSLVSLFFGVIIILQSR